MTTAIRMPATIVPGPRIEITSPELPENGEVEVISLVGPDVRGIDRERIPMLEIAESVPPGPRPYASWTEYDKAREEDKGTWDR